MRSLRPPPKVTPPKPPARLFEPRDDIAPVRLEEKMETASSAKPYDFEDDVKFQMQQLENEMKLMLAKDRGVGEPSFASSMDRRADPPGPNFGAQHAAPDTFPSRINPSDWKVKGFPSEFAYMKATGQLDIPSNKPIPQSFNPSGMSQVPGPSFDSHDSFMGQNKQQMLESSHGRINPSDWKAKGFPSEFAYMKATGQLDIPSTKPISQFNDPNMARDSRPGNNLPVHSLPNARGYDRDHYEKEIVSPARRKGGALQNLYVEEDELQRKFANQHSYSDQLQQQVYLYIFPRPH